MRADRAELAQAQDVLEVTVHRDYGTGDNASRLAAEERKAVTRSWRPCRLEARRLKEVADWVERYRRCWEESFDRLDEYLEQRKEEKNDGGNQDKRS